MPGTMSVGDAPMQNGECGSDPIFRPVRRRTSGIQLIATHMATGIQARGLLRGTATPCVGATAAIGHTTSFRRIAVYLFSSPSYFAPWNQSSCALLPVFGLPGKCIHLQSVSILYHRYHASNHMGSTRSCSLPLSSNGQASRVLHRRIRQNG